jgi:putative copper export protein/methionine-rich copper-binding protein CopC
MMNASRPRRSGVRVFAAVALVLATPGLLSAHQYLRASAPAEGERLEEVPAELRLTFSEAIRVDFTEVVVQGPDGALALGALRRSAEDARVLVVPVEGGWHAGGFEIRWMTVGSDGHRTDGRVSFVVEEQAAGLPEPEPDAPEPEIPGAAAPAHHDPRIFPETPGFGPGSPAYVGIRVVLFAALIALLGALSFRLVVLPIVGQRWPGESQVLRRETERGAARLGLVAAVALLAAALARLGAQSASLFGTSGALQPGRLAQALSLQPWATGWWLQVAAAAVAVVGFLLAARSRTVGWGLAAAASLVAAATPALSGHAVALSGLRWLAVPVDLVHVAAAGGWIGGLLAVVVVGIPAALRLDAGQRRPAAAALVQAFSPTALAFTATLLTTGVISAWLHLGDVPALWGSAYGRTLLIKLGIFSLVAVVGAYNFLRVRPAAGEERGAARLRRSGTVELLLALAVVVVTAVLVAVPPPGG